MGLFSHSTAGAFRYTKDGRRLFARRYLVVDADLDRVASRITTDANFSLALVIVASTIARQQWGDLWGWLAILLILPVSAVSRRWITSGLPVVNVPRSELEPVDRQALERAAMQAKGRPATWVWLALAVAMAALGGALAFTDGVWYGWFLFVVMSWCAVKMFQLLWRPSDD
jgi:hypothetical protein